MIRGIAARWPINYLADRKSPTQIPLYLPFYLFFPLKTAQNWLGTVFALVCFELLGPVLFEDFREANGLTNRRISWSLPIQITEFHQMDPTPCRQATAFRSASEISPTRTSNLATTSSS